MKFRTAMKTLTDQIEQLKAKLSKQEKEKDRSNDDQQVKTLENEIKNLKNELYQQKQDQRNAMQTQKERYEELKSKQTVNQDFVD